ncbi:UNVERIFIED_CONTAM: hypothetical protein RMT77_013471 [Armadillidium vulgare]
MSDVNLKEESIQTISLSNFVIDPKMSFEELRKKARQLEHEIDNKLVAFSKLAASYGSVNASVNSDRDSDTSPLLTGDQKYETISTELEQLLSALSEINERMNNSAQNSFESVHTLQRHKDILQDYTKEYQRTNSTIKSRKERQQLLSSGRNGTELMTGLSRRDMYLKESEHLVNSERLIDEQINIALETRDHLKTQREAFKMLQTKMNDLTNRFPVINTLMTKINFRRRRDALVLGSVIGLCLTFMMWWILA